LWQPVHSLIHQDPFSTFFSSSLFIFSSIYIEKSRFNLVFIKTRDDVRYRRERNGDERDHTGCISNRHVLLGPHKRVGAVIRFLKLIFTAVNVRTVKFHVIHEEMRLTSFVGIEKTTNFIMCRFVDK
jgi:hypothetical protein